MSGCGFEWTFDEDQQDQYQSRNNLPDDLLEEGKLFETQFEQVCKSSICVPLHEIPLTEVQTPGFGFLANTPFWQIYSHFSDRTPFEINDSSFYSEAESHQSRFLPRKKGLGRRRFRRVSHNLHSFEVYLRPARKKHTRFSRAISPCMCSRPYKYQVVIVYPNDVETVVPKFFLKFQCQDTGKYMKSYDAVSTWPGNKRRLKRHFKSGTIVKFLIQITQTSNRLSADDLHLCIEDEKTNVMFYHSEEFKVYARKQDKEREFWKKLFDKDLEREEQRSLVDEREEEEEVDDGETSSDEEYVVKKPRKRRMRKARKKKKKPEEMPKRRESHKMSLPPKKRKTPKIGRKRKRGSEVHEEDQNHHFLPIPNPLDCDLQMPDFNLPEKEDQIYTGFPHDLQDKSVLPLPPPIVDILKTPPRHINSRNEDILEGNENNISPVSMGMVDKNENEAFVVSPVPQQVVDEEASQRKSRRVKKRKTYHQYAPEVPEKRKKNDVDYVYDEMEDDYKDYM